MNNKKINVLLDIYIRLSSFHKSHIFFQSSLRGEVSLWKILNHEKDGFPCIHIGLYPFHMLGIFLFS